MPSILIWTPTAGPLQGLTVMQQQLPDKVWECLWSQEVTGTAWIDLEQNVIDTAVNEWRKRLLACFRIVGQHSSNFTAGS